ncbi:hypothetical protein DITRI_Ditri03aG0061000 [Diplodiscus trichospermus]
MPLHGHLDFSFASAVHVYDVKSRYENEQEIDLFSEISRPSFSVIIESLFISEWACTCGNLLEYGRQRDYAYLTTKAYHYVVFLLHYVVYTSLVV